MKNKLLLLLSSLSSLVEMVLAVVVLIAVLLSGVSLLTELGLFGGTPLTSTSFDAFLAHALALVIGLEFIKMLTRHTPGAVIEVLLFAIARQLIVYHTSLLDTLIGMIAVAGAFFIRKYLFVDQFDPHAPKLHLLGRKRKPEEPPAEPSEAKEQP